MKKKTSHLSNTQAQRIENGRLKAFIRAYIQSGEGTTFQLESALNEDSVQWEEEFFDRFLGTEALRRYYLESEDNRNFLNSLFRSAFMYGGAYFMSVLESVLIEESGN